MAYEYSSWMQQTGQSWAPFWKWLFGIQPWYPPGTTDVADRYLDKTKVYASTKMPWPASHTDLRLGTTGPSTAVWQNCMPGLPIQRVAPDARFESWTENNTYTGTSRTIMIPVPMSGDWWVEGNPNIGGAWDKHVLLVCPETGVSWEMIGVTRSARACLASATYVKGQLTDGMPVCAANVSMTAVMMNRDDPPHRLGIAMNNYAGRDGTETWGFPTCGDVVRLAPEVADRLWPAATEEQRSVIVSLRDYGARIYDRSGGAPFVALGMFAGTQWHGSSLGSLDIKVRDLELVTG